MPRHLTRFCQWFFKIISLTVIALLKRSSLIISSNYFVAEWICSDFKLHIECAIHTRTLFVMVAITGKPLRCTRHSNSLDDQMLVDYSNCLHLQTNFFDGWYIASSSLQFPPMLDKNSIAKKDLTGKVRHKITDGVYPRDYGYSSLLFMF